jgi:hypothetical protein
MPANFKPRMMLFNAHNSQQREVIESRMMLFNAHKNTVSSAVGSGLNAADHLQMSHLHALQHRQHANIHQVQSSVRCQRYIGTSNTLSSEG